MPSASESLRRRITHRQARVAVLGLGYVGLPLAVAFAKGGFHVLGIDRDIGRIRALRAGRSYVPDIKPAALRPLLNTSLRVTNAAPALRNAEVAIICVPTPLSKTREPDVSHIMAAVQDVGRYVKPPALVILESTTYPGTTDGVVRETLERAGLRVNRDVFVAFSPERIDPGNTQFPVQRIPKILGGLTPVSTRLGELLYRHVFDSVVPVSSSRVAETAKLLENTFRIVNIALANEFALLCHAIGVDVWEVIRAASTKPFGFMPFYPGPGIGGHCIPSDPIYLSWRARAEGFEARLIDLAAHINLHMPHHVVERVTDLLNRHGVAVKGARILVVGAAYKRDVNDPRESPAVDIMGLLAGKGARVTYHDPLIPTVEVAGHRWRSRRLTPAGIRAADCVIIATNHHTINYHLLGRHARAIFDTRNAMASVTPMPSVVERL